MQGKNGLDIRKQQEKSYQNDDLFFLGFDKVKKMQASIIGATSWKYVSLERASVLA